MNSGQAGTERPEPRRLSLPAQYVAHLLEFVPISALRRPGSASFRAALTEGIRRTGVPLNPSRREVARGLIELDVSGRLPSILAARSGSESIYRVELDYLDLDEWDLDADIGEDLDEWDLDEDQDGD